MSVFKVFKPIEKLSFQFRAEAFNVFNHTQFSSVNSAVGADFFMFAGSAHSGRVIQLGLKAAF
jgi:hypothetical protein